MANTLSNRAVAQMLMNIQKRFEELPRPTEPVETVRAYNRLSNILYTEKKAAYVRLARDLESARTRKAAHTQDTPSR